MLCAHYDLSVAELPLELLSSVLAQAAGAPKALTTPGLALLARCCTVSRHFRAAAEAAAQSFEAASFSPDRWAAQPHNLLPAVALSCQLVRAAVGRWRHVTLDVNGGEAMRSPALAVLLARSTELRQVSVLSWSSSTHQVDRVGVAYLMSAVAGVRGVTCLDCDFPPAGALPPDLQRLYVHKIVTYDTSDVSVDLLLIHASRLHALQRISLRYIGGRVALRQASLRWLRFAQLRCFVLSVSSLEDLIELDLSWLALPRAEVKLYLCLSDSDKQVSAPKLAQRMGWVQRERAALQPQDDLELALGCVGLPEPAQQVLDSLHIHALRLELPIQSLIALPKAAFTLVHFSRRHSTCAAASVTWDALRCSAGKISLVLWDWEHSADQNTAPPELHLIGCSNLGSRPAGWQVVISDRWAGVRGLPEAVPAYAGRMIITA